METIEHPEAWRLEVHPSLPSTSDLCITRAREGEPGGLAIQALLQTAGRGSRSRAWDTMHGNLALSVLLRPHAQPAAQAGQWAFAAAVAVRNGLSGFADDLTLKWPNDVLHDGRKVAGLLVDSATEGENLAWVVLGMGANLLSAPPAAEPASIAPAALGPHDPRAVAVAVLDSLSAVLARWREQGFAAIRELWLAHAHPAGTPLRVRSPRHDVRGTFAGLSPEGALLLDTPDGLRAFSTGEVLAA